MEGHKRNEFKIPGNILNFFSWTRTAPLFPPLYEQPALLVSLELSKLAIFGLKAYVVHCKQAALQTNNSACSKSATRFFYGRAVLMVSDCQTALTLTCYLQWLGVLHFIVEEDFLYYFIQKF